MSHQDWTYCDGHGGLESAAPQSTPSSEVSLNMTRRGVIASLGLGALGLLSTRSALAQVVMDRKGQAKHTLVSIFLRGGADGLSMAVPYGEDAYYRARPNLALGKRDLLDLDGFFGLHPSMRPLYRYWHEGKLQVHHAIGSEDGTRSHFEAMRTMEYGVADGRASTTGGWLARYLTETEGGNSPLRAVALGSVLPDSLRGALQATTVPSLDAFRLEVPSSFGNPSEWISRLTNLYAGQKGELAEAGQGTLHVLETVQKLQSEAQDPNMKAAYPDTDLGRGLRDVATLIRAEVGLEVACLDRGAWDTHVAQGTTVGWLAGNLGDLAGSVAAFMEDLGPRQKDVTVVIQTEFGRRVEENVGLGTDHGRASVMMVLGEGLKSGKVQGKWPGLERKDLDEVGDMRVATDYREVLAEVLRSRMKPVEMKAVFPGWG